MPDSKILMPGKPLVNQRNDLQRLITIFGGKITSQCGLTFVAGL